MLLFIFLLLFCFFKRGDLLHAAQQSTMIHYCKKKNKMFKHTDSQIVVTFNVKLKIKLKRIFVFINWKSQQPTQLGLTTSQFPVFLFFSLIEFSSIILNFQFHFKFTKSLWLPWFPASRENSSMIFKYFFFSFSFYHFMITFCFMIISHALFISLAWQSGIEFKCNVVATAKKKRHEKKLKKKNKFYKEILFRKMNFNGTSLCQKGNSNHDEFDYNFFF